MLYVTSIELRSGDVKTITKLSKRVLTELILPVVLALLAQTALAVPYVTAVFNCDASFWCAGATAATVSCDFAKWWYRFGERKGFALCLPMRLASFLQDKGVNPEYEGEHEEA